MRKRATAFFSRGSSPAGVRVGYGTQAQRERKRMGHLGLRGSTPAAAAAAINSREQVTSQAASAARIPAFYCSWGL